MGRHYLLSQINNKRNNLTFFNFLKEQNNKGNTNSVCLTIKNYKAHKGLSSLIFEDIKKKEERVYLL